MSWPAHSLRAAQASTAPLPVALIAFCCSQPQVSPRPMQAFLCHTLPSFPLLHSCMLRCPACGQQHAAVTDAAACCFLHPASRLTAVKHRDCLAGCCHRSYAFRDHHHLIRMQGQQARIVSWNTCLAWLVTSSALCSGVQTAKVLVWTERLAILRGLSMWEAALALGLDVYDAAQASSAHSPKPAARGFTWKCEGHGAAAHGIASRLMQILLSFLDSAVRQRAVAEETDAAQVHA